MDRDVALRIDGMLMEIRAGLNGVAHYVKTNCTERELKRLARLIGSTMGATIDISQALYDEHPDILPRELRPANRQRKRAKRPI